MDLITVSTIFLASLNMNETDSKFAYNTDVCNQVVCSQTVYKKSENGLYLSHHLKYNFSYDEQERLVRKEVLKWDVLSHKWEKHHCLVYSYQPDGYAIEYVGWDDRAKDYANVMEKHIYREVTGGALAINCYKWNRENNGWVLEDNILSFRAGAENLMTYK